MIGLQADAGTGLEKPIFLAMPFSKPGESSKAAVGGVVSICLLCQPGRYLQIQEQAGKTLKDCIGIHGII